MLEAASLCERLTANEKGFGGADVGRSRGLWLGVLRAPIAKPKKADGKPFDADEALEGGLRQPAQLAL